MQLVAVLIIAALVFGVCFLVDKGFTRLFRNQAQHKSGKAVRLSKRYGSFGLILAVLGLAAIFTGLSKDWVLIVGGGIVMAMGIGLIVYYMTFGIFYDEDSFILTTFGKTSKTYYYRDIQQQQLYSNQGHMLVELYLSGNRSVQLQAGMPGAVDFLNHAYAAWLRQTGRNEEDCPFHDPANGCWFPPVED